MKTTIITLITVLSSAAFADGFVCETQSGLSLKVYNHTEAQAGTRVGATMIISNPEIGEGNKTIARFSDANGTLQSDALTYTAEVDLRFNDSGRKGELIGGTKLGQLKKITLYVNFSYAAPLLHGEETSAVMVLVKRNGERLAEDVSCLRYLKN